MCGRLSIRSRCTRAFARIAIPLVIACHDSVFAQEPMFVDLPPASVTLVDHQFASIQGVRELSDGRLLVSDSREGLLYVVDWKSMAMGTIGRRGQGPREYGWPGHLYALAGDSTFLTDEGEHRLLLLFADSIVKPLAVSGLAQLLSRGASEGFWGADRDGRLLAVEGYHYAPGIVPMSRVFADSLRFLLTRGSVVRGTVELDTVGVVGGQGRQGVERNRARGGSLYWTSPLASEGQAWLFADGWIALAYPDPYRVDWRTPEGRWIHGPALPFTRVSVNRDEKCFAIARHRLSQDSGCRPDVGVPDWPEYIPAFLMEVPWVAPGGVAVREAPNGALLVRRSPTAESSENRYDVVDRRGTLLGAIRLQSHQAIVGAGHASLYVVAEDTLGLLTLSRHPWPIQLVGQS